MKTVDIDKVWTYIGVFGRYQRLQMLWFTYGMIGLAYSILIYVFAGYRPPYSCHLSDNDTIPSEYTNISGMRLVSDTCEISLERIWMNKTEVVTTLPCNHGYKYDIQADTIITEWDLVCEEEGKAGLTQSLLVIGQGVGGLFLVPFADRFGRKLMYIVTSIVLVLSANVISLSPNYYMYIVMKFIIGLSLEGFGMVFYTYILEMFPKTYRGYVGIYGSFLWTTNVMSLTFFGYTLQNYSWRYLHLAIGLLFAGYLFLYWFCDESLRWLVANNKMEDAIKLVAKVAKKNKRDPDEATQLLLSTEENGYSYQDEGFDENVENTELGTNDTKESVIIEGNNVMSDTRQEASDLATILKNGMLRKISLIWIFIWFTNNITYYGLLLASVQMKGSRFLNYFINGAVEIPSNIMFLFLLNRINRRKLLIIFSLMTGIPMMASALLLNFKDKHSAFETVAIVCSFVAKMGISGSYNTIFVYLPETYPTNLRTLGLGMASAAAHTGGIIAPFFSLLVVYVPWAPSVFFGVCCLVMAVLVLFLPETRKRSLPQTVDEMMAWT